MTASPERFLSIDELAELAGTTVEHVRSIRDAGILSADDGARFPLGDVHRVRIVRSFESAGIPLDILVHATSTGWITFAYYDRLHAIPGPLSPRTYGQLLDAQGPNGPLFAQLFVALGLAEPDRASRLRVEDEQLLLALVEVIESSGTPDLGLRHSPSAGRWAAPRCGRGPERIRRGRGATRGSGDRDPFPRGLRAIPGAVEPLREARPGTRAVADAATSEQCDRCVQRGGNGGLPRTRRSVSNSPNFEYATALKFFERSTHNLLAAEAAANVGHHVALSVVGTKTLSQSGDPETTTAGYFRAKQTQEELIAASGIPFSIVHATQFYEFIKSIADEATDDGTVRVPSVAFQPMAADDVASGVGRVAAETPVLGIVEIGGPERFRFDEPVRRVLAALNDPREVVTDPDAGYYGIAVGERTLVPGDDASLGEIHLDAWLRQQSEAKPITA